MRRESRLVFQLSTILDMSSPKNTPAHLSLLEQMMPRVEVLPFTETKDIPVVELPAARRPRYRVADGDALQLEEGTIDHPQFAEFDVGVNGQGSYPYLEEVCFLLIHSMLNAQKETFRPSYG